MIDKIKALFGIYNLRDECAKKAQAQYGDNAVKDFLRLYDSVNAGKPIMLLEAFAVIDIVETTKKELKSRTIFGIAKKLLAKAKGGAE